MLKSHASAILLQFKQYIDLKNSQDYTVWQLIWVLFKKDSQGSMPPDPLAGYGPSALQISLITFS